MQVDKYTFPPAGATGRLATPSHKLNKTFKFRDYAPKAFKKLRHHFGIEEVCMYQVSHSNACNVRELQYRVSDGGFSRGFPTRRVFIHWCVYVIWFLPENGSGVFGRIIVLRLQ